jgi:type I restriction enzyme, S subunit
MAGEWHTAKLGLLLKGGIRHGVYKPLEAFGTGTRVLKMGLQYSEDRIGGQEMPRVPLSSDEVQRFRAHVGDLLFSRTSMMSDGAGKCSLVVAHEDPFVFDGNILCGTPDTNTVDPAFIYFYFKSPEGKQSIAEIIAGTQARSLSGSNLADVNVFCPPLPEQRAIAHILGTLDDKIELNRRMIETLDAMARALFKSWFVDFDPVRAKAEGGDPDLPKPLAGLFPARLVDSELGEIPEGWEISLAGDLFDVAIGKTPPRKEHQWFSTDPQDIPWMSIRDLGQAGVFISEVSEYLTANAVERFRVRRIPDGTVVLSFKLTVGRVAITDGEMLSNEAIAHFVPRSTTFLSAAYLYCYLREFDYNSLGSTSSIATAVNSDSVRAIPVLVPCAEVHKAFLSAALPAFFRLRALQRECRTLAALRETLLPKLISGEVRIEDAERLSGRAV